MKLARWCGVVAVSAMACVAVADTIKLKSGKTIVGAVHDFETGKTPDAAAFVVLVDGEHRTIPAAEVETIRFSHGVGTHRTPVESSVSGGARTPTARKSGVAEADETPSGGGSHWLTTSSRKRHNERCRYYKTGNGRPCGPDEGIPCKICGG